MPGPPPVRNGLPPLSSVLLDTFRELKGKIKEKVGQLTNNPNLEGKGFGEKTSGKMQKKIGDLERVVEKP
jgi:uncharacterized protein YjbJ (UPF0337 family)